MQQNNINCDGGWLFIFEDYMLSPYLSSLNAYHHPVYFQTADVNHNIRVWKVRV